MKIAGTALRKYFFKIVYANRFISGYNVIKQTQR